jgi:MFS family permease
MLLLSRIIAGLATESSVAQAYIADITPETDRAAGMGKAGAALGAGFIVGPAISGVLSVYGYTVPGFIAAALAAINFLFVLLFLPESTKNRNQKTTSSLRLQVNLRQWFSQVFQNSLINYALIVWFIVVLAFSTIPIIVPLLSIVYFNFSSIETSYLFIYIGVLQIILQGFLITRIIDRVGEEQLLAFSSIIMTIGILMMPLRPHLLFFGLALALVALGNGMMQTIIPSFISKRTNMDEQGNMLGVVQSVASIARIPGPLLAGLIFELWGLAFPFYFSAILLSMAFVIGCKVFQICSVNLDGRGR